MMLEQELENSGERLFLLSFIRMAFFNELT